jgi:threonine/homoserine/homoserine lactone efflux protein
MENLILIGSILSVHIFAWFTPGPNLVLIIRNSLVYSRRTGFFTAVGFSLSNFVHILLAIAGIGLLLTAIPLAQNVVKFVGVGYLLYLGVKTFFMPVHDKAITAEGNKKEDISPFAAIKTGFITNVLSPKAPLFFGSIFGTLLASDAPMWVVIFLLFMMPFDTLIMACLWSLFFSHHHVRKIYLRFQSVINKCLGIALLLVALTIIFH